MIWLGWGARYVADNDGDVARRILRFGSNLSWSGDGFKRSSVNELLRHHRERIRSVPGEAHLEMPSAIAIGDFFPDVQRRAFDRVPLIILNYTLNYVFGDRE